MHANLNLADSSLLRDRSYIDGEWRRASGGSSYTVTNPATSEVIGSVPDLSAADIQDAIAAAESAGRLWRKLPAKERGRTLRALYDAIVENREDLARLITLEQGKPLKEARGEVDYGAAFIEWYAEEARRTYGTIIPSPSSDTRFFVIRQPVGVVAAITPWNFPLAMITRKLAPALAAGCTVIAKPAEQTPLTALALARLAEKAGVPRGVFNVVTGDAPTIGAVLTSSPIVRKLSFTGSTEIGRLLLTQCAPTVKKMSLELGGHAPFIVFDDADLENAVAAAMVAKFRVSGQSCIAANRFYVQEPVYERFCAMFAEAVARLRVGNGLDEVDIGPMIEQSAIKRLERHVGDAVARGARVLTGGKALDGLFFQPTVLADVPYDAVISREETFGPVAPIFAFREESEIEALAAHPEYGLASYVMARDSGRIWRVAEALEFGMVGVNTGMISNEAVPFGGIKCSGLGREGSFMGMNDYIEEKYVAIVDPQR